MRASDALNDVAPYVERLEFLWRTDGILLFRLTITEEARSKIHEAKGPNRNACIEQLQKNSRRLLVRILRDLTDVSEETILSTFSDILAKRLCHFIKIQCGHTHSFHDPHSEVEVAQIFLIEPIRIAGTPTNFFRQAFHSQDIISSHSNNTGLQEAESINAQMVDSMSLRELATDRSLAMAPALLASSPSVPLPGPLALFRQHCKLRDELVAAVEWRKNKHPAHLMVPIAFLALFCTNLVFFAFFLAGQANFNVSMLLIGTISAFGCVLGLVFIAFTRRRLPFTLRSSHDNKFFYWIISNTPSIVWILVWITFSLNVYVGYLFTSDNSSTSLPTLPMSLSIGLFAVVYGLSIVARRHPVTEMLLKGIGFLEYYSVYAAIVTRLYREVYGSGFASEVDAWRLQHAAQSLRIRYEREMERMKREQEFLLFLIALASALAAFSGIFGDANPLTYWV